VRKARRLVAGPTPPIAEKRKASAARKIQIGIDALKRVKSAEAAWRQIHKRGWPTSTDGFRRWMRLGNDTFYGTHAARHEEIEEAIKHVVTLSQRKDKPTRREGELASLHAKVTKLQKLLSALGQDLLSVSEDRDLQRRTRLVYEQILKDIGVFERAPLREDLPGAIRHPRQAKVKSAEADGN
jgi:hypothetical protein